MSHEDEDLARAIALSLQETSRKHVTVINVDSSDEDEDVEEVQFQGELRRPSRGSKPGTIQISDDRSQVGTQPSTFLSERAQLEKERMERLKRLRPDPPRPSTPEEDDDSENEEPPAKRHQVSTSYTSFSRSNVPTFWNGELRQTATQHAEPRKDGQPTFRLTEVLGKKSDLAFAILSSYALDLPWIYQFFDPSVPVIMVAQPDASGEATIKNVLPHWIRTTPYLRAGFGCQHMKLFYKTGRLRVVISTANLISYDWRDMENTVWLQDIPLRAKPIPHDPKGPDDFAAALQRVLHAVNVRPHPDLPIKAIEELRQKWDWSNVKAQLVSSIAGKHEGWPNVIQTGHPRLMSVVRKLGMRTGEGRRAKDLILECQGSSIGIYTTQWMNEFHWSARGESAESWLDHPKRSREKQPYPPVKIIFPQKQQCKKGGGTIFCRRKQWAGKNFPRTHFYDSRSKAGPVLMHSKMIIAMLQEHPSSKQRKGERSDDSDDDIEVIEPALGWAYIGSHNFTPSAWGTLSGSSFNPILNISNYELGIVILLKDKDEMDRVACFQRPPKKYTYKDEPWIQEESSYHQT
ncbi:tyrosyl-DNA phosphodiesterase-domain-containing protein [Pholiota molesta]|nr:tyrosyl-DNA phosphodiesterase-domain-containing protein [Pholiota molesta]